jgi:hypothetical protein
MPCTNFIGPITPILIVLAPQAGKLMDTTRIDANKMTHNTLNFFILYPPFPLEDSHCKGLLSTTPFCISGTVGIFKPRFPITIVKDRNGCR